MYGKDEEKCMKNKTIIVRMITTKAIIWQTWRKDENDYENEDHIGDGGKFKIRTLRERVL